MGSLLECEAKRNDEIVSDNDDTEYRKFVRRLPGSPGFLSSPEAKHPIFEHVGTFISPFGGASIQNRRQGLLLSHLWRCHRCQLPVHYRHCVITKDHCVCLYCYCEARLRCLGTYLWLARRVMDGDGSGNIIHGDLLHHIVTQFVGQLIIVPAINETLISHWYQTNLDRVRPLRLNTRRPVPLSFLFATRLHDRFTSGQFTLISSVLSAETGHDYDTGIVCDASALKIGGCGRSRVDDTRWHWLGRTLASSWCNSDWCDFLECIHDFTCRFPQVERVDYNVVDHDCDNDK